MKHDLLKEKMVKNMRSPPGGRCATRVKNSMSITSTLSLSSNKAILPVPHSSLHSNQVIYLSSKANAELQATDLSSTSLQYELAIESASRNASLLTSRRELISVPPRKSVFISRLAFCANVEVVRSDVWMKITTEYLYLR